MLPGVRSSLVFSGFGHKPPASGVQSYSYSRLLHLYSTDDKTSRLKMKSFSTVRNTQRGSQSYMEKRRGRREIEVTRRRSSVQFSSVTRLCPTLCNPMNRRMPGLPVHHQLLEFSQTHVHRVRDAIQPSPPASNPSQHQSLFQ